MFKYLVCILFVSTAASADNRCFGTISDNERAGIEVPAGIWVTRSAEYKSEVRLYIVPTKHEIRHTLTMGLARLEDNMPARYCRVGNKTVMVTDGIYRRYSLNGDELRVGEDKTTLEAALVAAPADVLKRSIPEVACVTDDPNNQPFYVVEIERPRTGKSKRIATVVSRVSGQVSKFEVVGEFSEALSLKLVYPNSSYFFGSLEGEAIAPGVWPEVKFDLRQLEPREKDVSGLVLVCTATE